MKFVIENPLFLVNCTLAIHPSFYISASDIVEASIKAKEIIDSYNNEKYMTSIKVVDIPILDVCNV